MANGNGNGNGNGGNGNGGYGYGYGIYHPNWRTTTLGLVGLAAGLVAASDFGPVATKIAGLVVSFANSAGLMLARDASAAKRQVQTLQQQMSGDTTHLEKPPTP